MGRKNHVAAIARLAESEGVFTTTQARRVGIPRDALHDGVEAGRLERVLRGAYRLVGSGSSPLDELVAVWKLTAPGKFTHERLKISAWDGVVVGGSTAASLQEIGDLHLSPYRLYAPRRINTRNPSVSFAKRTIAREEAMFVRGVPVTRPERTVFDLVIDDEDFSLVADVLRVAAYVNRDFDFKKLRKLLGNQYGEMEAEAIYQGLLSDVGLDDKEA